MDDGGAPIIADSGKPAPKQKVTGDDGGGCSTADAAPGAASIPLLLALAALFGLARRRA